MGGLAQIWQLGKECGGLGANLGGGRWVGRKIRWLGWAVVAVVVGVIWVADLAGGLGYPAVVAQTKIPWRWAVTREKEKKKMGEETLELGHGEK